MENFKGCQASFFDLDHTLLKVNSSYSFGKFLYHHGVMSTFQLLQLVPAYFLHKAGIFSLSYLHHITFKKFFMGLPRPFFKKLVDLFLNENFEKMLYLPAFERLNDAKQSGHFVAILSNSPDFLVEGFAKKLDVPYFESSVYGIDKAHRFSHIKHLMQGSDKAACVARAIKTFELSNDNISIYSDSILDLAFLLCSGKKGKKVGVNPDKKLRALCQKNNWEII